MSEQVEPETLPDVFPEPQYVALAGDWHGNLQWAVHSIRTVSSFLPPHPPRIMIQLGDFGFRLTPLSEFDNREHPLDIISHALDDADMELWWIDGNHDDHPGIAQLNAGVLTLPPRIRYIPRGARWTWAGRTWLAVGGAASVDRLLRTEGVDWWPEEELTDSEAWDIASEGEADVMLCHDCPAGFLPQLPPPAQAWIPELPRAAAHAERLRGLAEAVQPQRIFHGHFHVTRDDHYSVPWRTERVRVNGLTMDGYTSNIQIVDVNRVTPESCSPFEPEPACTPQSQSQPQ